MSLMNYILKTGMTKGKNFIKMFSSHESVMSQKNTDWD